MKLPLLGNVILIRNGRFSKSELYTLLFCVANYFVLTSYLLNIFCNEFDLFPIQSSNSEFNCSDAMVISFFTNVLYLMHWYKRCICISCLNITCLSCSSHLILGSEVIFFDRSLALHRRPGIQIVVSMFIRIRKYCRLR